MQHIFWAYLFAWTRLWTEFVLKLNLISATPYQYIKSSRRGIPRAIHIKGLFRFSHNPLDVRGDLSPAPYRSSVSLLFCCMSSTGAAIAGSSVFCSISSSGNMFWSMVFICTFSANPFTPPAKSRLYRDLKQSLSEASILFSLSYSSLRLVLYLTGHPLYHKATFVKSK